MNVEIEFENYNIKSPKMPDPFNVNLINAVGSGGGGGNEVELTWAEYEALSDAEKMNGTNYFITDINTTKSLTKKTLLGSCQITSDTSYTLSDSIFNYDYIIVNTTWTVLGGGQNGTCIIPRDNFVIGDGGYYTVIPSDGRCIDFGFTSSTTLATKQATDVSGYRWEITGYIYQRVVVPNQMINYSTIETKIGTWIDGKPLYQKTIYIGSLTTDTNWHEVPHGISNFKKLIDMKTNVINSDLRHYSNNGYRPSGTLGICFSATTSSIFYMNNWLSASDCYVTLIYTKTTD